MQQWFAIKTKARREQLAAEHLERQDFEVFLPRISLSKQRRGRWQTVVEALFPGYLFVHLDLDSQNVAPIRSTRGVLGLVRLGGEVRAVPDGIIDDLRARQIDGSIELRPVFKPNDPVILVDGPMAGLNAVFKAQTGLERVTILLEILGRTNVVTVSPQQIISAM